MKKLDPDANLARLNWEVVADDVEADGVTKGRDVWRQDAMVSGNFARSTKSVTGLVPPRNGTKTRPAINLRCS